ncbi:MAG: hypothetical protein OEZ29_07870 [Candidatus Bathyarchaeota archaeon]|nr:hypothetical protein [Candidatus Bathyarchaeota archaeon]
MVENEETEESGMDRHKELLILILVMATVAVIDIFVYWITGDELLFGIVGLVVLVIVVWMLNRLHPNGQVSFGWIGWRKFIAIVLFFVIAISVHLAVFVFTETEFLFPTILLIGMIIIWAWMKFHKKDGEKSLGNKTSKS